MVSNTVLVALVTGGFTLSASAVGAYIHRLNMKDQIQAQNEQLRAEFLFDKKVEVLAEFHSVLIECRWLIAPHLVDEPQLTEDEYYNHLRPLVKSYQKAQDEATLFLHEREQFEAIHRANEAIMDARLYLGVKAQGDNDVEPIDLDGFLDKIHRADTVIREEISEPLETFEPPTEESNS